MPNGLNLADDEGAREALGLWVVAKQLVTREPRHHRTARCSVAVGAVCARLVIRISS